MIHKNISEPSASESMVSFCMIFNINMLYCNRLVYYLLLLQFYRIQIKTYIYKHKKTFHQFFLSDIKSGWSRPGFGERTQDDRITSQNEAPL